MLIDIDEVFDLDLAMTLPEYSNTDQMNRQQLDTTAEELIEGMPTVVSGGGCAICLEGFRLGVGGKRIPCGHVFHSNCIAHWVSLHNSCPLCRFSVSSG
ncbi:hypothetical protein ACJIZ3_018729 [Penstemon smallii]|uniref:RING-type E3 ubiquitin transferase n=1 Tax=Penstemon smallii TaxID=265156 RepID=A0ABD3T0M5_9LAMI